MAPNGTVIGVADNGGTAHRRGAARSPAERDAGDARTASRPRSASPSATIGAQQMRPDGPVHLVDEVLGQERRVQVRSSLEQQGADTATGKLAQHPRGARPLVRRPQDLCARGRLRDRIVATATSSRASSPSNQPASVGTGSLPAMTTPVGFGGRPAARRRASRSEPTRSQTSLARSVPTPEPTASNAAR